MTTQATHTKGPWHTGQGNGEGSIFCESGRTRLESGGTTLYPVCTISRGWDEGEDEANARLIATAPEMLEALRNVAEIMSGADYSHVKADMVRAICRRAISKAEGRAGE